MVKTISSLQNPFIKQLIQLKEKSKLRKKTGLFVIEGKRELSLAIKGKICPGLPRSSGFVPGWMSA